MRGRVRLPFLVMNLAAASWALVGCGTTAAPAVSPKLTIQTATTAPTEGLAETQATTVVSATRRTAEPTVKQMPTSPPTSEASDPIETPTRQPTATAVPPTSTNTPEPTPTPPTSPTPAPRSEPRLIIPALDVDAVVVPVGLDADGAMAAPADWFEIGWFRYGPRPGFAGSAALAGHLDTNTGAPATFWNLGEMIPGQEIFYQAEDGSRLTFLVDEIATYPWDEVPLERVFARSGEPRLTLITCGGQWSREHRNYSHRTIVYASLQ